ncbi:MAG TPA: tRNA uridine-5-carboxymethylaminomethyl(34) synthesis GTPase MnmE [Candidatus Binataceae bacterium]|nr:tRNA uridine-5-carboxymethylaminomethyl(34) synthesis GTPase MnmE [Candidatus Binataceae bacterium]
MYVQDTIVAPATAAGRGAVAIVRLSGPRAIAILDAIWRPPGAALRPRELKLGDVIDSATGAQIDRAMATIMIAPKSLTGEDVAEIQCHGGAYIVRRIVALAIEHGARMAEPGEFSRRAFLNGRIDLAEAEAVADLVEARSETALAQALAQLSGALSERVGRLRNEVIAIRAHLEAEIDFADENIELPARDEIARAIERLGAEVATIGDTFARGRIVREGIRAAIVGKPNAGKSSLLNLMLGAERAIVTAVPGTTRDVIEDFIALGPYSITLADTAGMREAGDEVERLGIERTARAARDAELLIAAFDASRPFQDDDARVIEIARGRAGIALLNKRDLPPRLTAHELRERGLTIPILGVSALVLEDAAAIRAELERAASAITAAPASDEIAISRERHRVALEKAAAALAEACAGALKGVPPEMIAVDVMAAADALGQITGEVTSEDVLDAVFREFCIGK